MTWLLFFLLANDQTEVDRLTKQIAESGQVVELTAKPSEKVAPPKAIAPGPPPLLSFRYFDGKDRHRFGNLDLMLDDAGH